MRPVALKILQLDSESHGGIARQSVDEVVAEPELAVEVAEAGLVVLPRASEVDRGTIEPSILDHL